MHCKARTKACTQMYILRNVVHSVAFFTLIGLITFDSVDQMINDQIKRSTAVVFKDSLAFRLNCPPNVT